ncbi:MAG: DUF4422 domain-containing protein [Lachnospiraceae bacterium]|nr:DUF4422 domain-containing protein [Lachnospiraceae bacterium]
MDIKIIVAAHKPYQMPSNTMYLPVQVGAEGKKSIGFTQDNTGDNISAKNPNYCELTGLYWAWKNLDAEYLGLVHYRRYFKGKSHSSDKWEKIVTKEELESKLEKVSVLLPKARNYLIESNYKQYVHSRHAQDLDITREIIAEKCPEYIPAWETCMKSKKVHLCNMMIMERSVLDRYCTWLFDILFELEKRLDISNYSRDDARVYGLVSERLIDVWLTTNSIRYEELPVVYMEKQHRLKKYTNFVLRKVGLKKGWTNP